MIGPEARTCTAHDGSRWTRVVGKQNGARDMDGSHFDALTRSLGRGTSRRRVIKGMLGGVAGMLAGKMVTSNASAAGRELTICHATGNPESPYETLTIPQREMNQYARQGDFLRVECCADADCSGAGCWEATCSTGYCVQLPTAQGAVCDDGLVCTSEGACDGAGNCTAGAPIVCAETDNPCTTSVCDEATGGCHEVFASNGSECGINNVCVSNTCLSGVCQTSETSCPAGDVCHEAGCDPERGCYSNVRTGEACTIAGSNDGRCGEDGECHVICLAAGSCSDDGDCGTGEQCIHGGCFTPSSPNNYCSNECATCFGSSISIGSSDYVCADFDYRIGPCDTTDDCPSGSFCNHLIKGHDGRHLCTRPCPQP